MLSYERNGALHALDCDTYYLQTEWDGAENTLHISLPAGHPQMLELAERTRLYESGEGQTWRVSKYDRGKSGLTMEAELDLDELCTGVLVGWDNQNTDGSWMTLGETVQEMLDGTGWTLDDQSQRTDRRQLDPVYGTTLEGISQAVELWGNDLGVQYDNAARVVHLISPGLRAPTGCYLTEDLNLLECPQVRGKAKRGEYYNRLYLVGKDGLRLPAPYYVEHRAESEPVLSACKVDESIEDADTLLAAAQQMVDEAAAIPRSYTCRVADLERLRPKEYAHLRFALYDSVILIDRDNYSRQYQQIARLKRWPAWPEKNEVTLSTVPGTLSARAGTTYSLARTAAARAYASGKDAAAAQQSAQDAAKTATNYITEDAGGVHYGTTEIGVTALPEEGGLAFSGIRNKEPLWINSDVTNSAATPSPFAAQEIALDLSSYSAILILYTSSADAGWFAGTATGQMTSAVLPVSGQLVSLLYTLNTLTRRNVIVSDTGIEFLNGYSRYEHHITGVVGNTIAIESPGSTGWDLNNQVCVPCYIYGFM